MDTSVQIQHGLKQIILFLNTNVFFRLKEEQEQEKNRRRQEAERATRSDICCSMFVCLFGFNVAFKHLRSYHDGACL